MTKSILINSCHGRLKKYYFPLFCWYRPFFNFPVYLLALVWAWLILFFSILYCFPFLESKSACQGVWIWLKEVGKCPTSPGTFLIQHVFRLFIDFFWGGHWRAFGDLYWALGLLQEKLVANNYYLNKSAKDAYRSYILAYNSHSMKDIFNVHRLDLQVPL